MMQATILATAGLVARVLGFLYRIPMQNILGVDGTAVYTQGYSLYMLFFVISSAGMPSAISKMVSERVAHKQYNNAYKVLKTALYVAGGLGFLGMLAMYFGANALANFLGSQHAAPSMRVLAPAVFITAIMSVYRGYFQGLGNSMPTAISQVIEQFLNAIFSVFLVWIFIDMGIGAAAAGGTAASSLGALAGLVFIFFTYFMNRGLQKSQIEDHKDTEKLESTKSIVKEILTTAFPIVAGIAVFSMTNVIDVRMVTNILQNTGFSYHESLSMLGLLNGQFVVLTTLPVSVATAISITIIPSIAESKSLNEKSVIKEKVTTALRMAMLICIPAAVGLSVMGTQVLALLFPNDPGGGILLQVGAVSIIFLAISQVSTGILQGMNVLRVPIFAAIIGGIIKISLNQAFISQPEINIVGAVIATVFCYFTAASINLYFVRKKTEIKIDFLGIFGKPIFSSIIMGLVCYVTFHAFYLFYPSNNIALFIAICISILTYFTLMIFLGGITRTEINLLPGGSNISRILDKIGVDL